MMTTDVRFWEPRRHPGRKTRSYEVRWVVAGKVKSRTRRTKQLADAFLSELRQAARHGAHFDVETGLPETMLLATRGTTWFEFAQRYVDAKWPHAAATSRDSITDALATVTPALCDNVPGRPDVYLLREALRQYVLPPAARDQQRPSPIDETVCWLEHNTAFQSLN